MTHKTLRVPPTSCAELEKIAGDFLKRHFPYFYKNPGYLPLANIFEFQIGEIFPGYDEDIRKLPEGVEAVTDFSEKTIILSEKTAEGLVNGDTRCRFTLAHEFAHILKHEPFIHEMELTGNQLKRMNSDFVQVYECAEWQADYLGAAILMPSIHVKQILHEKRGYKSIMDTFGAGYTAANKRIRYVSSLK